jgi:hypothetical protein
MYICKLGRANLLVCDLDQSDECRQPTCNGQFLYMINIKSKGIRRTKSLRSNGSGSTHSTRPVPAQLGQTCLTSSSSSWHSPHVVSDSELFNPSESESVEVGPRADNGDGGRGQAVQGGDGGAVTSPVD